MVNKPGELAIWILNPRAIDPRTAMPNVGANIKEAQDMAAYLEAALETGDAKLVTAALGDIARAKGMSEIARKTGLSRESLYKSLSEDGNPSLDTVLKVARALGLRLHADGRLPAPVPFAGDS
jgi:probable addiction module antidote protein